MTSSQRIPSAPGGAIGRLADTVVGYPRTVIAIISFLTVLLTLELRHLKMDATFHGPPGHPYTMIDEALRERLGTAQTAVLALEVSERDVFTPPTLARLKRLTDRIMRVPGVVPTSVLSLAAPRVKAIRADADDLRIAPLLETIPSEPGALAELRQTVFSYPMYVGTLVTADGRGALISADFEPDAPSGEVAAALETLAAAERDATTSIHVGGQPVALAALERTTQSMLGLFCLAIVVIALVHYEAFRTVQAVVLPLVTALLSVIWGMGLLAVLGLRVTPWTAVTAILILSVAAGHAVQILKRYYECYAELGDNRAAVVASVMRVGPVMVTAGAVAAAGFASLATFAVPAVREFGMLAAFGILSALLIELTFIPACRTLLPAPKMREAAREQRHRVLDRVLDGLAGVVCARPGLVVAVVGATVLVTSLGIFRIQVNGSFRSCFAENDPVMVADRTINDRFTGTTTLRILVEGTKAEALLDPPTLQAMASLQQALAAEPKITATLSVVDYIQVMNRAMRGGAASEYRLPDSRALVAQYLLLYGPDDLARVLSNDYRTGAIYALARTDDEQWGQALIRRLEGMAQRFPEGVHVGIAGGELAQLISTNATVVNDKLWNMLQVSAVIFLLSALVFRSAAAGLLILAPLVCAGLTNLGFMGWSGTWLSFATAGYTSMGVSLGADFAIYLLFRLREELRTHPLPDAIRETLRTSGKAIFFVASAIAAGYAVLLASGFSLWRQLGVYVSLMMATSALAALTLLPALILLVAPRFLFSTVRPAAAPRLDWPAAAVGGSAPADSKGAPS